MLKIFEHNRMGQPTRNFEHFGQDKIMKNGRLLTCRRLLY